MRLPKLPFTEEPQETRFFLIISGWALLLWVIYWFVSFEAAGTVLLAGLAIAAGAMAVWLIRGRPRVPARARGADDGATSRVESAEVAADEADTSGGGAEGIDRPFHDETGRIPEGSLAPFSFGLGVALIALGPVFGLAPVAVGIVALLWGASGWFSDARSEHEAMRLEEREPDADEGRRPA